MNIDKLKTTAKSLYDEVFSIINNMYNTDKSSYRDIIELCMGNYSKEILEEEISNMVNIITSMRKISVLGENIPFHFYLSPKENGLGTRIILDVTEDIWELPDWVPLSTKDKGIDIRLPNSWTNIDFDISFKEQNFRIKGRKIANLYIKSLKQLIMPMDKLQKLIDLGILRLYINGDYIENINYLG